MGGRRPRGAGAIAAPRRVDRSAFRRRGNYLLALASEAASPVLRAAAALRADSRPAEPERWKRGLILGHNHLGDVLYRTCSLPQLRRAFPGCRWDYLTHPQASPLLEGNPHLDRVLPYSSGEESWPMPASRMQELRDARYDVALCTNTLRHHHDLLLAASLGIPSRVAFTGRGFSGLITHPVPFVHPQPYAGYFRSMVAGIGGAPADWPLVPEVYPSARDADLAASAWRQLGIGEGERTLACTISTRQPAGAWPLEYFECALKVALDAAPARLIFCGAASDMPALRRLAAATGGAVLADMLPIRAFAAFLRRCDVLFAMDSGPRHLGNAVGTPVVFMRNLTFSKVEAGAYCANETDAAPPLERLEGAELASAMRDWPVSMAAERLVSALRKAGEPEAG